MTASSFLPEPESRPRVDLRPSAAPEAFGTAIVSSRSLRLRLGTPTRNSSGVSTPCVGRMHWPPAQPNAAHRALAEIEQQLGDRFYLCTQNVDDLHERAGSHRVHHMHGTLFQSRCERCDKPYLDQALYETAADLPLCQKCGASIRPHIVWFGELPLNMEDIYRQLDRATVLLVIGTSGSVYPAAGLALVGRQRGIRTVYVGPEEPSNSDVFDEVILGTATEVLPNLFGPGFFTS